MKHTLFSQSKYAALLCMLLILPAWFSPAAAQARKAQPRRVDVSVAVVTPDGKPVPNADLTVGEGARHLRADEAGRIVVFGKVQGRKRSVRALADNFAANAELLGRWPIGIAHAGCRDEALALAAMLKESDPKARIILVDYEPVTGSHVGPDTLALFFMGKDRELSGNK